jgi:hypothetical protein
MQHLVRASLSTAKQRIGIIPHTTNNAKFGTISTRLCCSNGIAFILMGRKISDSSLKKIFPNKQIQKQRKAWEIKGDLEGMLRISSS